MGRLEELASQKVRPSEHYSINGDYIEAAAFAWLAFNKLNDVTVDWEKVTGASKSRMLGVVFD